MKRNNVARIVEFTEDDFRENPEITQFDERLITDGDWEKFAENALVINDGMSTIYQYAEEFPIVVYFCSEDAGVTPNGGLNTFIESITVSTADCGKRFSLNKREMEWEYTGPDTVVYYTDNTGRNFIIQQNDIFKFMLKKPNLVISSEGLLVFFTQKNILVTSDCEHYVWVHDIDTETSIIKNIEVYSKHCIVILENTENDEDDEKPLKYSYKLRFDIDLLEHGMITAAATEI